jgi:hypothetical protein
MILKVFSTVFYVGFNQVNNVTHVHRQQSVETL